MLVSCKKVCSGAERSSPTPVQTPRSEGWEAARGVACQSEGIAWLPFLPAVRQEVPADVLEIQSGSRRTLLPLTGKPGVEPRIRVSANWRKSRPCINRPPADPGQTEKCTVEDSILGIPESTARALGRFETLRWRLRQMSLDHRRLVHVRMSDARYHCNTGGKYSAINSS
jgi:hypothetical protein